MTAAAKLPKVGRVIPNAPWPMLPLGEVGRWFGGGTPSKANAAYWTKGTIPWVSPKDMKQPLIDDAHDHITEKAVQESSTNMVEAGSVLVVARSGILQHTLPVAITTRPVALNQDIKAVKPNTGVAPEFLAMALKAFEREILHTCTKTGTTVQSLELPVFHRFKIPVPPLPDQRRIVAEIEKQFTRLDAGIAALRRTQANLKRYRAAVLKAACEGRLVPTEAELANQQSGKRGSVPRKNNTPEFDSGTMLLGRILTGRRQSWARRGKYLEPSEPKAANLAPIPDGWAWATTEQLTQSNRPSAYGVLQPGADISDGVPFVRVGDINGGKIDLSNIKRISPSIDAQYPRTKLHGGELAITLVGAIGRTAIVPKLLAGGNTARAVGIVPLSTQLNSHWVEIWFRNPSKILEMTSKSHEVARKTLNLEDVRNAPVAIPPLAEQTRIVAEVERRLSVVEELETAVKTNLQRATRLRQSILQQAFRGALN
jgi:type I restriction enzyme S subunit